jgi:malate dehydrogenase (oxaloacetate-decarboxylating)(NADP+)
MVSLHKMFGRKPFKAKNTMFLCYSCKEAFNTHVWSTNEHGAALIHNPLFNKGTSFTASERERLGIRGLVPPAHIPIEKQEQRILRHLESCQSDVGRYVTLSNLMDRNETLYYYVVSKNLNKLAPIIYTPTVGKACQNFSSIYRRSRGMYFTPEDKSEMHSMVYNWPVEEVDVIVVTDGSRILGLGDLGCQGMGIPIGKLALYVAVGGVNPAKVLPIQLDFGTNNKTLLDDPLYIGRKTPRVPHELFIELMDEFMSAVYARWPKVLVQFEDFSSRNAFALLERYKENHLVFNDDIQGTGAVALAGIMGYLRVRGLPRSALKDQKIVCLGGGSAGIGVMDALMTGMMKEGLSKEAAAENIYILDSKGLIGRHRAGEQQLPFAKPQELDGLPLLETIKEVKPSILLGLSGAAGAFTEEIIREMMKYCDRPFICPMSNPTDNAECTTEDAFKWSDGRALLATGSPFDPVEYNGKTLHSSQANNMYVFPSLGLMSAIARPSIIPDSMFYVVACSLASSLTDGDMKDGKVYPGLDHIREVSKKITIDTCIHAWDTGIARNKRPPSLESLKNLVDSKYYVPEYQPIVRLV